MNRNTSSAEHLPSPTSTLPVATHGTNGTRGTRRTPGQSGQPGRADARTRRTRGQTWGAPREACRIADAALASDIANRDHFCRNRLRELTVLCPTLITPRFGRPYPHGRTRRAG